MPDPAVQSRQSAGAAAPAARRPKSQVREWTETIVIVVLLTFLLRSFVIQAFRIPSASMENTLLVGDYLFVNKLLYGAKIPFTRVHLPAVRAPRPGDIIVFRYPLDPSQDFIKRCVAVEGQTVEIRDKRVYVDGVLREEPFTKFSDPVTRRGPGDPRDNLGPIRVPARKLFMMGDNRDNSADSRYWGFIDRDQIQGKAIFVYWSWDPSHRVGFIPAPRLGRIGHLIR